MTFTPSTFSPMSDNWVVTAVSGPTPDGFPSGSIPARVPGVIHTDLRRAGLIAAPFDGDNEAAQQWIGDTVWRYETAFTWSNGGNTRHDLVAYGLDTVATIELNGTIVAKTENQHRRYRFDVRSLLIEGENSLAITFAAPVPETLARATKFGALPRVNHHDFNQLRKTASHFGWDWGIDVAGSGIWQPIGIDSWSGVRIASVRPLVDVEGLDGVLSAHVEIERDGVADASDVSVTVNVDGITVAGIVAAGVESTTIVARVPAVKLWWPIGHGEQPLYGVTVSAGDAVWTGRIGFRTVSVDTSPDEHGNPFRILVNGELVLARGVNWIPDHAFLTEINRDRYGRRLDDAIDANVNLIRVWGGGIYESDDFYELADERGLLVWQDFLFACAAYSEEDHLHGEVVAEATEQITRLSPHPSLIIWNGNNENIWGFADWGWRPILADRSWGDGYYREVLPALVTKLDPSRFYSPGSPYSFGEYLHPNDQRNGTVHVWDVWNQKDYTAYRDYKPRFVSEFGFQGPPAWSTLVDVVHDEPLDPYGREMLVHQKAHLGNVKLERGVANHLPETGNIEDWHWATQLNQAHAVRFGVEHFRSLTPLNTGTILWQLNDNWPAISWAAVDFDEHRKPLWYALRAAYAPRLATLQPRASQEAIDDAFEGVAPPLDSLALVVINDTANPFVGAFRVSRQAVDGSVLAMAELTASVAARGVASLAVPSDVADFDDGSREVIVAVASDSTSGFADAVLHGAEVLAAQLEPNPLATAAAKVDGGYTVTVTATSLARDVFVNADRVDRFARVDQGLLTLMAGNTATFTITSNADDAPAAYLDPLVLRTANSLL
jgi:beta-mannosidase